MSGHCIIGHGSAFFVEIEIAFTDFKEDFDIPPFSIDADDFDLLGLAYMFAIAGEQEIIKSEFLEVFKKAAAYDTDSDVIIVKEMYHSFQHSSALKTAGYYMNFLFHKIRSLM